MNPDNTLKNDENILIISVIRNLSFCNILSDKE